MRSTQRIALLLVLVFFIPVMFFSLYELSSLDEDEKMIANIYDKQLESILFSVNQYSDDIITNWVAKVETGLQTSSGDSVPTKVAELLDLNSSLIAVLVFDTVQSAPSTKMFFQEDFAKHQLLQTAITQAVKEKTDLIRQLTQYKKNGFQKIEQLADLTTSAGLPAKALLFISQDGKSIKPIVLVIDGQVFIDDIIGPRLQTISRDQFVLSVLRKPNDSILYSTATQRDSLAETSAITKDFWIFPEYSIGIYSAGEGIEKLISERTRFNVLLLGGLIVVLIIALALVFRSLKKEVDLAQNKADFVSNVSHEIRTPLALISMFSETLEMNRVQSEEKKQEYYRILSKETQRLTRIVNKILNFSQAEAKKKKLRIERLNMKQEIQGVLDVYDYHLRSKGFSHSFDCPEALWLRADKEALIETFINLLDNAIKYSEEARVISITAGSRDEFAYLSVKDSGVGISKKDQKYIFDKFYRVPKGDLARTRGTGLGLAFVRQLTEKQKGKVSVESESGKGSTFTIYYPLD
jgi:two-component system, OmpR family, phosphate regulon sensor histidine kinase PhoR